MRIRDGIDWVHSQARSFADITLGIFRLQFLPTIPSHAFATIVTEAEAISSTLRVQILAHQLFYDARSNMGELVTLQIAIDAGMHVSASTHSSSCNHRDHSPSPTPTFSNAPLYSQTKANFLSKAESRR